jgi:hypothetical protein
MSGPLLQNGNPHRQVTSARFFSLPALAQRAPTRRILRTRPRPAAPVG